MVCDSFISGPRNTAYDDAYITLLRTCPRLIIPVINHLFGMSYTGSEEIIFTPNERTSTQGDDVEKHVANASFFVITTERKDRYYIDCETNPNHNLERRMLARSFKVALKDRRQEGFILQPEMN
ncbi:MAG: hypothetical protein IJU76_01680 [Desulfovibrionaceae bacterium]|nr:hypothetical protein [Desulfovibrionaceae bacterium]